jgi:hypothetical protein
VGEALASHPDVDMVSFTDPRAGKRVSELASKTVKKVALELGGKSANVILDDADSSVAFARVWKLLLQFRSDVFCVDTNAKVRVRMKRGIARKRQKNSPLESEHRRIKAAHSSRLSEIESATTSRKA